MKALVIGLSVLVACTSVTAKDENDFVGEWVCTDRSHGGITKLVIDRDDTDGDDWTVQAWGNCNLSDCDWYRTKFHLVGDSSSSKSFERGFAKWEKDFFDTFVSVTFEGVASVSNTLEIWGKQIPFRTETPQIKIEVTTVFKDNGKHSDFRKVVLLHKRGQSERAIELDGKDADRHNKCLGEIETITLGMTRAEVEEKFPLDGGLSVPSSARFTHPDCRFVKVNVEFDVKTDPEDQGRAVWGKDDKVTKVSAPYIETPIAD